MMNSMRKMANGFVSKLLMLFLVITFGVWGIGDIFRSGGGGNYAAKVGNETISLREFEMQKSNLARQMEAVGMKDINASALSLNVIQQLVQQRLIYQTMRDLGLYVNEALLSKALRAEPAFQKKDGSFNKEAFTQVLQAQHISEGVLLNQVKNDVSGRFLTATLDMGDITQPAPVRALNATAALETRDAWVVTIAPTNAPTIIPPEALTEFYEQNKAVLYVKPESRTLEYVALKPSQIEAAIDRAITDQMVKDAKKLQPNASTAQIKERLRQENRENGMHALEASLDDALAGGANLNDALNKANLSAPIHTLADVKEGSKSDDETVRTVTEQGFQMGDGETSGLIMTKDGTPLIVHVKSLQVAGAQPYETVASDVHDRVAEQLRRDTARKRVAEVREALNGITGDTKNVTDAQLKSVLSKFNLTARRVNGLSRPHGSASDANGIPLPLQQAIFERQVGAIAGPLALASGSQMLAIVSATHQPDAATINAKSKFAGEKGGKEVSDLLNQTVQAQAFGTFAEKHRIKVNQQLLTKSGAAAGDAP